MHDDWASTANREAAEYVKGLSKLLNIGEALTVIGLGAMAYWGIPTVWIVIAGFAAAIKILGALVIDSFKRLDAGRAYPLSFPSRGREQRPEYSQPL